MIAEQAGVATFNQPILSNPGIGSYTSTATPGGYLELVSIAGPVIAPASYSTQQLTDLGMGNFPAFFKTTGTFNNLGIPGVLAVEYATATSSAGSLSGTPFIDLVLRGSGSTALQTALAQSPTIATVWLGNNDVLGFATGSAADVVPAANVEAAITAVVGALVQAGSQVVLANIPDVLGTPYFTTVDPYTEVGGQKVYWIGPDGLLTDNDLVTLSGKAYLEQGIGVPAAAGGTGNPAPGGGSIEFHRTDGGDKHGRGLQQPRSRGVAAAFPRQCGAGGYQRDLRGYAGGDATTSAVSDSRRASSPADCSALTASTRIRWVTAS